jgi:serine/threonine protein kinase, bacterial
MPLADGTTFAEYTIVRRLGVGGMGEVYLAKHPRLSRQDALKILLPEVSADAEYRERFHREADIAASLWHPHILEVHDTGEFDGQLWLSMDYVDGTDADSLLSERYLVGLPPREVAKIVMAVAEALDYSHQRSLLHRDVKPANILIAHPGSEEERIMLADFGIARRTDDTSGLTGTNMTVGTVLYAAPEQLMGAAIDGRADQYALAATAFHLLTGKPPFEHSNPAVVISQHLTSSPPSIGDRRPDLSDLDEALSKALAKEPGDRFARCVDFANALCHRLDAVGVNDPNATRPFEIARAAEVVEASQPTEIRKVVRSSGRHEKPAATRSRPRPVVLVAVVLAILLLGAVALALFEMRRADDEVPQAPTTTKSASSVPPSASRPALAPLPSTVEQTTTTAPTESEQSQQTTTTTATPTTPTTSTTTSVTPTTVATTPDATTASEGNEQP